MLVDLGHGTVRHRQLDEKSTANSKVKTGYFYHARLEDFSESMFFVILLMTVQCTYLN